MKARLKYIIVAVVILSLFVTACSGGYMTDSNEEVNTLQFEGILLHEGSILITKSKADQLSQGQLISLNFPTEWLHHLWGAFMIMRSIPRCENRGLPGQRYQCREIKAFAGHTVITFDTAEMILEHLPQSVHLIDVRTVEEYEGGHISGAQNIPMGEMKRLY